MFEEILDLNFNTGLSIGIYEIRVDFQIGDGSFQFGLIDSSCSGRISWRWMTARIAARREGRRWGREGETNRDLGEEWAK